MPKSKTTYCCEICKEEYKYYTTARYCEQSVALVPCPLHIGQKIWVYDRYGYGDSLANSREEAKSDPDYGSDIVTGLHIGNFGYLHSVEESRTEEEVDEFLSGREYLKSVPDEKTHLVDGRHYAKYAHEWMIDTQEEHRMSKDQDSYTSTVSIDNIETTNHWLTSGVATYENESQFLKSVYVDGHEEQEENLATA